MILNQKEKAMLNGELGEAKKWGNRASNSSR